MHAPFPTFSSSASSEDEKKKKEPVGDDHPAANGSGITKGNNWKKRIISINRLRGNER